MRPVGWSWAGFFSGQNNRNFFWPDPNPAGPEKFSNLATTPPARASRQSPAAVPALWPTTTPPVLSLHHASPPRHPPRWHRTSASVPLAPHLCQASEWANGCRRAHTFPSSPLSSPQSPTINSCKPDPRSTRQCIGILGRYFSNPFRKQELHAISIRFDLDVVVKVLNSSRSP
jgi:hypothetical protein